MAKLGFFNILNLIFLHAQLETASHKIKQSEWNAYFDWYLGSSKRGSSRVSSLQETNKKLLETVPELTQAANPDPVSPSAPPTCSSYTLFYLSSLVQKLSPLSLLLLPFP